MATTPNSAESAAGYSFELAPTVDIARLSLSAEEGVVVSRMLGRRLTIAELVRERVVPADRMTAVVDSLVRKGAVVRIGGSKKAADDTSFDGVMFSAGDLAEAADLTEDQKKRILFVEMHLDEWHHYKLLGLKKSSSPAEVKSGYFRASKEFHPDAYFRKNLGSYKERIDRIFRAMKGAYDVLSDPARRAEYDKGVVEELTTEEREVIRTREQARQQVVADKERDERNAQRMRDARLKRNPITERLKKARDFLRLAEDAQKAEKFEDAANHARLAMGFDEALKARAEVIILDAERARAANMMKRALQILSSPSDTRELAEELSRAADGAADIATQTRAGPLLIEVADVMLRLNRANRAAKLAQMASEAEPKNARAWEVLAEAAAADGKWAILLKATERWLALEPTAKRPRDLQRDAKRHL